MPHKKITKLKDAIRAMHGCESLHVESVPVKEAFEGQTAWEGNVEVFDLISHPKAKRAYAWSYRDGDQNKTIAVLGILPVDSPQSAVKVAIASKSTVAPRNRKLSFGWYRYLYVYAAFWGFVTYSCATHTLATLVRLQTGLPNDGPARLELIISLILWPLATIAAGWVTYRLLARKVTLNMIYVL